MTGKELLDISLDLLGLRNIDGALPSDTNDLRARATAMINILLAENSVLDGRIRHSEHKIEPISSLDDTLDCSDSVAYGVLPYGLARLLMIGEDDALAGDLNSLYLSSRNTLLCFGKPMTHPITEVYK
ncbi:MAG: hypothetical protein E7595_05905 [Ruminococcaceae bacterium]|nr:hypothetical protein [Oscillospiraceae bacterium]